MIPLAQIDTQTFVGFAVVIVGALVSAVGVLWRMMISYQTKNEENQKAMNAKREAEIATVKEELASCQKEHKNANDKLLEHERRSNEELRELEKNMVRLQTRLDVLMNPGVEGLIRRVTEDMKTDNGEEDVA